LQPILSSSPKKSFHLPIYANAMAHASITNLATPQATPRFIGDHRILQYLDLSTIEDDVVEGLTSDGGDDRLSSSFHSTSGSTSSSHSDCICSESSASDFAD
jgi:hypothetical protein